MIARAFVIFVALAFPLYLGIKYVAEARLTREQAAKVVKTTGLVFVSATLAGVALSILMIADKLL